MGVWEIMDKGDLIMIVSVLTLACAVWAVYVAREIAFMQQWNSLVTEYRSKEFGESVQAIVDFWIDDCNRKVECVESAYIRRVEEEKRKVEDDKKNCKEKYNVIEDNKENSKEDGIKLDIKETLRFHRRTLLQFYWHLQICLDYKFIRRNNLIRRYFDENEINLMAIVYEMTKVDKEKFFRKLIISPTNFSIDTEDTQTDNSWRNHLQRLYRRFKNIFPEEKSES